MSESAAAALKNDSGVKRIKIRWMKQMVPLSNRENVEDDMTRIKEKVEKGRTARKRRWYWKRPPLERKIGRGRKNNEKSKESDKPDTERKRDQKKM